MINKPYKLLEDYFGLDLTYDSLPNSLDESVTRTNITLNGEKTYPITNEATGFIWITQLLTFVVNREDGHISYILIDEPESFLHPAFQKRLLMSLLKSGIQLIIATHSSVFIDQTLENQSCNLFHLINNGLCNDIKLLNSRSGLVDVVRDIGVKPSQILQTNGVIWVEGITDRIYIKKWIQLYCEKYGFRNPVEGIHYSFIEYGGKCLSHISFEMIDYSKLKEMDLEALIPVLSNNINNYVVIDSDRGFSGDSINETKLRVLAECKEYSWLTSGKEVENYLPRSILDFKLQEFDSINKKYKEHFNKGNTAKLAQSIYYLQ